MQSKVLTHPPLREFAERAVTFFSADARFTGLLAGGSAISRNVDAYSDLDLILVVREESRAEVLAQRRELAERLGPLLYAFTGEHVREPRLLICLYGSPILHVDLKFITLADLAHRVEDPLVLWDRDGSMAEHLSRNTARWPDREPEWFEERVWVWLHYGATKLGRGELLEVIDLLAALRSMVLGPMVMRRMGVDQRGVRRLEALSPELAGRLATTLGAHSREACATALRQALQLYLELREDRPPTNRRPTHEAEVQAYLDSVLAGVSKPLATE
ncbi:aminoglycoside 6-adenylyltransferase [Pyxidicoccus caerfyrddinensis]|uniref:aminoglycoside 6-adenylyltransferase n=1 Tax=Pyxidicoccus caerfyrddinensis TaxID=2709663 RepID=UPI0013DBB28F|nr:aminoglycoside 6-adenylyltransferase [Pyxidicoccus caerfyrddinensis]